MIIDNNISSSTLLEWTVEITKSKIEGSTISADGTVDFMRKVHETLTALARGEKSSVNP